MIFHSSLCGRLQLGLGGGGGKGDVRGAIQQPLIGGNGAVAPDDALGAVQYGVIAGRPRVHRLDEGGIDRIQGGGPVQGQVPGLLRVQPQGGGLFQPYSFGILPKGLILPQQIGPVVVHRGDAVPPGAEAAPGEAQSKDSQGSEAQPPLGPPGQPPPPRQSDHRQGEGHDCPGPQGVLRVWRPAGERGEQDRKQQQAAVKNHDSRCHDQGGQELFPWHLHEDPSFDLSIQEFREVVQAQCVWEDV